MTDAYPTTPNKHPHLYSARFVEDFFQLPKKSTRQGVRRHSLRFYGRMAGGKAGSFVFTAEYLTLWLSRQPRHKKNHIEFYLSPDRLDSILQAELERCPPRRYQAQYLLSNSPDSIVWVSDFVHHGGRTQTNHKENENAIQPTSEK